MYPQLHIIVEASARHVHVTAEALATLFGPGAALHNVRELSQPGQFLTEEKVRVEGPRGGIDRVSILGPERPDTQVELSLSDARRLGIAPPIRESGQVAASAPCRLVGPCGAMDVPEGVIAAKRHIHITPEDAALYGLSDKEVVRVEIGGPRALIFDEVIVRESPRFRTRMHIDIDEYNAAGLSGGETGLVVKKTQAT
ncbi:MAG: phosphate propanoyltransferase [Oscillospiraceae bacterium]|nr:phosphate propanoyltransferase [Oscillospiraceae bacterium]